MIRNVLVFLCCGMALFAASAQAQPRGGPTYREAEGVLDHFLCYRLENPDWFPPEELGFRDQFSKDPEPAFVQRRAFLCNPVEKDDRKRLHPEAHLLCYWIEGEKAPPQVRVANQLHPNQLLWLRKAALICAPTGKEEVKEGKPPNPEPPKIPAGLDHFKCYPQRLEGMQPPALRRQHNFTDQFRSYVLVNFSARFLCNPAAKYRWGRLETPVLHDFAHLVCYVTYPQVTQNRRVRIANQFERDATLDVLFLQMACFPSTKMVRR